MRGGRIQNEFPDELHTGGRIPGALQPGMPRTHHLARPLPLPKIGMTRDDPLGANIKTTRAGIHHRLPGLINPAFLIGIQIQGILALPRIFQNAPARLRTENNPRVRILKLDAF